MIVFVERICLNIVVMCTCCILKLPYCMAAIIIIIIKSQNALKI